MCKNISLVSDNFHLKIASIIYNMHAVASKHTSWSKLNPRLVLNIRACNWECTYCIEYMLVAGACGYCIPRGSFTYMPGLLMCTTHVITFNFWITSVVAKAYQGTYIHISTLAIHVYPAPIRVLR